MSARWRPSLATSIFLLFALLLGLALGAAVFVTWREGRRLADDAVQRALDTSAQVQTELAQRRLEEVQLKVELVGRNPDTVKYVSEAQGGGLGLGDETGVDQASINDLLDERRESYGFDLGIVLDAEGKVLARTDQREAFDQSFAGDPFVEPVLRELTPVSGFWRQDNKLYQAALMPLDQDQDLVGFLLIALEVNDDLGQRVGKASGSDVAYLLPVGERTEIIGTSLDAAGREALVAALAADQAGVRTAVGEGKSLDRAQLAFGGQQWAARLKPLDIDAGSRVGATLQLTSADRASAGYREMVNRMALAGLGVLLVALPLSFLLAKVTLRPLRTMAHAAKDAASGHYRTQIGIAGRDELADLSHAFDQLLSDLREKSDMQGYVSNLSRFLPDPGQERAMPSFVTQPEGQAAGKATVMIPPMRETMLLLGLELRGLAKLPPADAEVSLAQVSARTQELVDLAARHGGSVLANTGTRALLGFAGAERQLRALHVARVVLNEDLGIAAAMFEGEIVHGTVTSGTTTTQAAIGAACFALDRLLAESAPGRVLLPRNLGEAAKALLGEPAVAIVQGAASGKQYYGIDKVAIAALPEVTPIATPVAAPDPNATQQRAAVTPSPGRAARGGGELAPGTRFGGRYEILSVLGAGGMGVVYKARDIELDDVVALKMLRPSALVDNEQLERLKSEIKLARRITHPNVLRTFDFGEHEGLPYISMEYVRGMTLRYLLKQAGRLPYSAALRIARQLCAGLAAAHEVGVLHRDIKPENLILEASGNAKLMDFGIARPTRRSEPGQTAPGTFVGTPHYSSPEQLAGEEVDERSDIYSSGVMFCEMFCGRLPFTGANTMEIYLAQMQQEPIKPSEHWPEIPAPLEALILRCIARDPGARFQDANELATALAGLRA
jgi:serine/threonine-protein kinase